ncbi:UBX domain-containing protein 11 isoform X2 [Esox lucius]|uniref:UBX domain-containing protein 11 n=1 Tax=Esox lucius TaxID=8010 RepID=A0A3P8YVU1_ESOLU|nr:UBX domain-containing protein 11 isoform X2 [Esox lucius]
MSSPLSTLGKNRRLPFPVALNQQGRRVLFERNPFADYEAALLNDISTSKAQASDIASLSKSNAKQRKTTSNCPPPSNFELMSSMMQKLTLLETKVRSQTLDIDQKDKKIAVLEEKLKLLQKSREQSCHTSREDELVTTCESQRDQILEMEFLKDYGMLWVGSGYKSHTNCQQEVKEAECIQSSDRGVWQPEASTPQQNFQMNYDLVLRNIWELNVLAGEGESYVRATSRGAQLARQDPVPLRLYSNGILMFNGPFRSYQEASTQRCMQDFMDGYFPSELQQMFPEGVPFKVHDMREEEFKKRRRWEEFPGKGQAVFGAPGSERFTDSLGQAFSQIPGRKLTMDQFLNRLPKVVVKAGRVIDIRDSVKASLQGSSDTPKNLAVTIIDTPVIQAIKQRLELPETDRPPSARDITTLRVKSEDGEHTYIVKMLSSETVRHLRQYLDNYRGADAREYDILSAFPKRRYSEDSQTLLSCGLTPSTTLLLQPRPRPPVCQGVCS